MVYVRGDGLGAVAVVDKEYPERVCFALLVKIVNEFDTAYSGKWAACTTDFSMPLPALQEYIQKYQDPKQADPIMRVQSTLKETEDIAVRSAFLLFSSALLLLSLRLLSCDFSLCWILIRIERRGKLLKVCLIAARICPF